jgi:hypothetical protein
MQECMCCVVVATVVAAPPKHQGLLSHKIELDEDCLVCVSYDPICIQKSTVPLLSPSILNRIEWLA